MTIKLSFKISFLLLIGFFFTSTTHATAITGTLTNTGGNNWQANYTITNDTLGSPLEEVTIWFDLGLYENLSVVSTPTNWDSLVIQPDPFIPDDGFYDVLALGPGIGAGASLSGFTLDFAWQRYSHQPVL